MIDPYQLRIGNYVNSIHDPLKVEAIFRDNFFVFDSYGQKLLGDNINPISIMDVDLQEFGFEKFEDDESINFMFDKFLLKRNNEVLLTIIKGLSDEWISCNGVNILFLHQLQNLYYALTGLDLDLE